MRKNRKGQSNAATLIAIVTAIIVLYILMLPPSDRAELLDGDGSSGSGSGSGSGSTEGNNKTTLILESPRLLTGEEDDEARHNLPEVKVFSGLEAESIFQLQSVYVKRSWFDNLLHKVEFEVEEPENLDTILLSFLTEKSRGVLTVKLNGKTVFSNIVNTANVEPIKIQPEYITELNTLEFELSEVGWRFWTYNEYVLSNIMITADVKKLDSQEATTTFWVSDDEHNAMERSTMKFAVDCLSGNKDKLTISVNGQRIFSAVPECNAVMQPLEVSNYLNKRENVVTFRTEGGAYALYNTVITTALKESIVPVYYFDIDAKEMGRLDDEDDRYVMTFEFIDGIEYKNARIYINGKVEYISTKEREFDVNIDGFLQKGTNSIKIIPEPGTSLHLQSLEIWKEDLE